VRDISERKLAEKAVATIVQQVRGDSGEAFFTSMAYYLAECLSADHAIIAELVAGEAETVQTIGVCSHGKIVDNFTAWRTLPAKVRRIKEPVLTPLAWLESSPTTPC
jgi:hypothetical protein